MGISRMGGKDGELIQSVGQMVGKFTGELYPMLGEWEKQLKPPLWRGAPGKPRARRKLKALR